MWLPEEKRVEVDRIKGKILKSVIGENCENFYYAITELNDINKLADNAIITAQKNPTE